MHESIVGPSSDERLPPASSRLARADGAPRIRAIRGGERPDRDHSHARSLDSGWELTEGEPSADGSAPAAGWRPAVVPGTVAAALEATGAWDVARPRDFDASDWWYRCRFDAPAPHDGTRAVLRFGGLATIADVLLNGEPILHSENMYVAYEVDVTERLRPGSNELVIHFRSLRAHLAPRRARPRWKTRIVEMQQMRWVRTTLLGRMPGWSPPVAPVGPWLPVTLELRAVLSVDQVDLRARPDGRDGLVEIRMSFTMNDGEPPIDRAILVVGETRAALEVRAGANGELAVHGNLVVADAERWWPHTHGAQPLYVVTAMLSAAGREIAIELGRIGFRTIALDANGGGFAIRVNDEPVFCRGACWSTTDIARLAGSPDRYRRDLQLARDAGMNMLRIAGSMMYETDDFFDLCDELGILVWQDFMFANMDYPIEDEGFREAVREEASQLLRRLQGRPSLAVLCGGSEVEQQAAMLGLPPGAGSGALFRELLPAACAASCPDVPYWPNSPSGGSFPFHADTGVSHYYGVSAYLRPLDDARRAGVRFTTECLAFANVPHDDILQRVPGGAIGAGHHPGWKARVPRDAAVSWDFEDVRDHYLELLFGVRASLLRRTDSERYLSLGRVVTGEVMASTFAEWRRPGSTCRGALVWFFRDLWPGAGFGILDADGHPKAAYYYLKRALAPIALVATDEGVNGLRLHAINDGGSPVPAIARVALFRDGEVAVGAGERPITIPARGAIGLQADELLGHFADSTYAYLFGPAAYDVAVGTLTDPATGKTLGSAFHFPTGLPSVRVADLGIEAEATRTDDGNWTLTVRTRRFAQAVALDVDGAEWDDDYFHVAPGTERTVSLRMTIPGRLPSGSITPLNARTPTRIVVRP